MYKSRGAATPNGLEDGGNLDAQAALRKSMQRGTPAVMALAPLINFAALLAKEPALASRITRVIAVMGRRLGHRFHPSENRATGPLLFGHEPIFRDLNATVPEASTTEVVLASGIPL